MNYRQQIQSLEAIKTNIEEQLRTINLILTEQNTPPPAAYYKTVGLTSDSPEYNNYIAKLKNKSTLTINDLQHLIVYYLGVNFDFDFTLPEKICYYESEYLIPGQKKSQYCSAQTPDEKHTACCEDRFIRAQDAVRTCDYFEKNSPKIRAVRARQIYSKALFCQGRYEAVIAFSEQELKQVALPLAAQGFYFIQQALANQKLGNYSEALKDFNGGDGIIL